MNNNRRRLKCGGKPRKKAFWGAAISAGATLAAAALQAKATHDAAKTQAQAAIDNARTQAQALDKQNSNNIAMNKENINFTLAQNKENRQQQQDIQTTLQMLAGKNNMNNIMERNKMQVKYGGRPKRKNTLSPFYGGGKFHVTDGGGVIPISVTPEGYGIYELYGNDHEHYHKTKSGKSKTGVGIKFDNGAVVEGEGNQNTNQGELLYVTPNDAMFLSKHSIDGFNPTKAVLNGVHPEQAYDIQERLKAKKGIADNGKKAKYGGINPVMDLANITQNPSNGTAGIVGGASYLLNNPNLYSADTNQSRNSAKCGKRIKLKKTGRIKAEGGFSPYIGAAVSTGGNLLGGAFNWFGNAAAGKALNEAYNQAGRIQAAAYDKLQTINPNIISQDDFKSAVPIAAIYDPTVNINSQLERTRRNVATQNKIANRETLSSAARQRNIASNIEKGNQQDTQAYSYQTDETRKGLADNANRVTQTSLQAAELDSQSRKDYNALRADIAKTNVGIENERVLGKANVTANALLQGNQALAQSKLAGYQALGNALASSGNTFATAHDNWLKSQHELLYSYAGLDSSAKKELALTGKDPLATRRYYNEQLNIFNNAKDIKEKLEARNNMLEVQRNNPNINFRIPSSVYNLNMNLGQIPNTIANVIVPDTLPINSNIWSK